MTPLSPQHAVGRSVPHSNGCAPSPHGLAGGMRSSPSRQRTNPQPVGAERIAQAFSLLKLAGRGFGPPLLLAFLAAPVSADTCSYGNGGIATTVSIEPGDESFAVVTIDNKLAHRARSHCDLTLLPAG